MLRLVALGLALGTACVYRSFTPPARLLPLENFGGQLTDDDGDDVYMGAGVALRWKVD